MLGSDKDPMWRDFLLALADTRGARRYVTLFEALFEASVLSDHENNALWASSLMAMPPPPPGMPFLAGLTTVDLTEASLTQWASYIQDVASGMRMPLEVAVNCPQEDIVGVLNRLEMLTLSKYCCLCFGIGNKCRCTKVPCQTPSQGLALWTPPTMSYATMASPTMTTASAPVGGVPPLGYPPPGPPPGDPVLMDTLPPPSTGNLLATAGVGRGRRSPVVGPQTPTAPGPHQVQPSAIQQRMPASGMHEAGQATPYQQQVFLPRHTSGARTATTKANATPSTSQGRDEMARGGKDAQGRSSSQGPHPHRPTQTGASATGASGQHQGGNQPTSD